MTPEQLIREARVMAGRLSMASADPANVTMCQATALMLTRLLLEMSDALSLACGGPRQEAGAGDAKVRMGRALEREEIVRLLQERADAANGAAHVASYGQHLSTRQQMMCANAAAAALESAAAEVKKRGG